MALIRAGILIITVFVTTFAEAQVNRYMVFFKDKLGSPFSTAHPASYLSQKAIARRIHQGITINEHDLPVNPSYIQSVKQAGVEVYFQSRWFNGVLVQCNESMVATLSALPHVKSVEYVAPGMKLLPSAGRKRFNLQHKKSKDNVTQTQLSLIGINHMHEAGVYGDSMTIAVFDAGYQGVDTIKAFKHLFENGQINTTASHDFVSNSKNVYQFDDHGTEVFSVMAASIPGAFTGGIPNAKFHLYVTEDATSEYRIEEYNWVFAAERADSAGVDVISSSLGYYDFDNPGMNYTKAQMNGETAVSTKAAQWAADRGILVVVSAGNEGNITSWRIITAPADAEDVIAVANVDQNGIRSSSSSIGPTADDRIKPDLAALGTGVKTIKSNGSQGSASGTSLATPLITSLAAGIWQRYPYKTNFEIITLLKSSASLATSPNNLIGYGIPDFKEAVAFEEKDEREHIFSVFPNPTTDTVTLKPIDPDSISECFIELITSHGQVLAQENVSFTWYKRTFQTDLASLPSGIYFLRVWHENKRYVFKVVRV